MAPLQQEIKTNFIKMQSFVICILKEAALLK